MAVRGGAKTENNNNNNNTVTLASENTENNNSTASSIRSNSSLTSADEDGNNSPVLVYPPPAPGAIEDYKSVSSNNGSNNFSEISSVTYENNEEGEGNNENSLSTMTNNNNISDISSITNEPNEDENEKEKATGKKEDEACEAPTNTKVLDALDDVFIVSDEAKDHDVKTIPIKIRAIDYQIRVPGRDTSIPPAEYSDPVYSDWKQTKFTQGETELLNSLELSPKLLYLTFHCLEKDWKLELAEFLYFLAVDACWPTHTVLTHAKCRGVREFLALVNAQICFEKLRKLEREKGKPSIPEGVFLPRINTEQEDEGEGPKNDEEGPKNDEEGPKDEGEGPKNDEEAPKDEGEGPKNDEEAPKDEGGDDDDILNNLSDDMKSLEDDTRTNTNSILDSIMKKIPTKKQTLEFFEKLLKRFKLKETDPKAQLLKKRLFGSKSENEETDDEIFNKIIRQIELVQKGNLGREILLRDIAKDLPEQYQTKEFMNRLVQEAIIDPKEPWYKRLKKKFFGKGGKRKTLRKLHRRTRKVSKKNLSKK